jgi:serine/threonine-protein kinase SRPK3
MNSNIIYNDKNDNLYILLYQIGQGAYSTVWFTFEISNFMKDIIKKKISTNNIIINPRALKIHNDDSYKEGMMETKINDIIIFNNKKSNLINYPLSFFVLDDEIVIVVYELALGSLYDILKKFDRDLDPDFILKIIPDMIKSIEFIHKCGYIHTDIKPENFLLMGISDEQQQLLNYIKKSKLLDNFKKLSSNKKYGDLYKDIKKYIYNFLKDISSKFKLSDNILEEDEDDNKMNNSSESNEDSDDNSNESSGYSTDSDTSYYTNCSSYDSGFEEYDQKLDIFHIKEILNIINNNKISNEINTKNNIDYNLKNKEKNNIKSFMINPIVKLTDFGCIKKSGSTCQTVQTRYYRSPEIILGLDYDNNSDIWSLGCSIYELLTGKILIDIDHDIKINEYDKDLINIKIILEKICHNKNSINDLFSLIKKSNRSKYIIDNSIFSSSIRFYKNINSSLIIDEIYTLKKLNDLQIETYKNYFNSMLEIIPKNRFFNKNI